MLLRYTALACLAATAVALQSMPALRSPRNSVQRARIVALQDFAEQYLIENGWVTGVDEASGQTYYYNAESGETRWDPPRNLPIRVRSNQPSPAGVAPHSLIAPQALLTGWDMGVDEETGQTYYYHHSTGQSQFEPPRAITDQAILWRLFPVNGVAGFSGVKGFVANHKYTHFQMEYDDSRVTGRPCQLPYGLGKGDEKVLSRWNMIEQKLTVDTKQCSVQCLDSGAITLTGQGDQPTLLRKQNGQWSPIPKGQTVILSHGDQISLDYSDPEGAVFECQAEMQMY